MSGNRTRKLGSQPWRRGGLWAVLAAATAGWTQQTNNYELRAVPAPGPVVLDGKLGDWDLSGEILSCYDLDAMRDTNSVRTAAMYDKDWLYVSFRFKDATPMVNRVDPVNDAASGWRSDCVQLRFWADHGKPVGPNGARMTHVDCYWFTDEARPAAFVTFHDMSRQEAGFEGKLDNAIGNGVDAAFRKDDDGKGYTQEVRISWKLLRRAGQPYGAGETLRLGMELFWGDATGSRWPGHRFADLVNQAQPQREFFWSNNNAWGEVAFLGHGKLAPSPSVAQLSEVEKLARLRYSTQGPVRLDYELPAGGGDTVAADQAKRAVGAVRRGDGHGGRRGLRSQVTAGELHRSVPLCRGAARRLRSAADGAG